MLLVGKSGSGKSVLCANLVADKRFFGGSKSFDLIFSFSPTGLSDDIQLSLKIPESHVFTDLVKEGIPALQKIQTFQEKEVKEKGASKAKQILLLFDDCIQSNDFMKSPAFIKCFTLNRHINCTVMLCSQHFKKVPRVCRLQASFLCFFAISNSEAETLTEEFAPPRMTKKQFMRLIDDTLTEQYNFLTINMKAPWEQRFRKNLSEVINLDYYRQLN